MATIVAAAGGGNWSAGGTWVGGVAPGTGDDAQLTSTSGNVTIDTTTCVCRSLDCTGYTGTLTHISTNKLSIGDGTAGAGSKALTLVNGMTYAPAAGAIIDFVSSSATQQTVDFANKSAGAIRFTTGSYILARNTNVAATAVWTVQGATFNTGNFNLSWQSTGRGSFTITSGTATLGSSTIDLANTGTAATFWTYSGGTLNAGTSTIKSIAGTFAGGGQTYSTVQHTAASSSGSVAPITGANTFTNLTLKAQASSFGGVSLGANQTVTGTLTLTGNSTTQRLFVCTDTTGTARTITAASITGQYTDFWGITGAGVGSWDLSAMTGGSGDCGGNTGITFTTPQNNYAVGVSTTANWSTASIWANSSGGSASSGRIPLPQDTAFIDSNSGAGTKITINLPRVGAVNWNKSNLECAIGNDVNFCMGLTITSALLLSGSFTAIFIGGGSQTINTNNTSTPWNMFLGAFGTYTLGGAWTSTGTFTISAGTLDTSGYAVTIPTFAFTGSIAKTFTLGATTLTLNSTAAGTIFDTVFANTTVSAASSTIVISAASANTRTFAGNGNTFGTLTYTVAGSTGTLAITGSNSFDTINFSDVTNARTLQFAGGSTTTIRTNFNVNGTSGKLMTISRSSASTTTVSKTSGTYISIDFVSMTNIVTNSAAPRKFAGANSTNGGGNTNWIFTAPVALTVVTGIPSETDSAFTSSKVKRYSLGIVSEAASALAATVRKIFKPGFAAETDSALAAVEISQPNTAPNTGGGSWANFISTTPPIMPDSSLVTSDDDEAIMLALLLTL